MKLNTFNQNSQSKRPITSFKITNLAETFQLDIENALISNSLSTEGENPPTPEDLHQFEHLKNLTITELENKEVGVLLDAKHSFYFCTGDKYAGGPNDPIALETYFGVTLIGPKIISDNNLNNEIETFDEIMAINAETITLADMINIMFRTDFISRESEIFPQEMVHPSIHDEQSLQQLNDTIRYNKERKRWIIGFPWCLGRGETATIFKDVNFFGMASSRHDKLKIKFEGDELLKDGSFEQMERHISENHVKILDNLDAPDDAPVCYLPNLVVTKPDKPGKFRICQDAAARVGKHSLNSYLFSGPDLLNKLITIIFKFRQKRYTLSADIKDYYYQIEVDPKDRAALRFLWWSDKTMNKTIVLESLRHIFGVTSSPTIANFVLRKHAEFFKDKMSEEVFLLLLYSFYVDDLLTSVDTIEEATRIKIELTEILKLGNFVLTKWKSNIPELCDDNVVTPPSSDPQVLQETQVGRDQPNSEKSIKEETNNRRKLVTGDPDLRPPSVPVETNDQEAEEFDENISPSELVKHLDRTWEATIIKDFITESNDKILGVGYDYLTDEMHVRIGQKAQRELKTKRDLLSFISSIYDPVGFVAPWNLEGRIYFQWINDPKIPWKTEIPPEMIEPVNKWKSSIEHLKSIRISRWTNPLNLENSISELVIFTDASSHGYGIVGYVRKTVRNNGGGCSVVFLIGKSHVVPTKMMLNPTDGAIPHGDSIPRLELCAAKIGAQWRDYFVREYGEKFARIFIFCDSLTVLNWLLNFSKRFKTYENFRIRSIQSMTESSEWRHVPSLQNPADLCSKGIHANDHKRWSFYHNGPEFLHSDIADWPPIRPTAAKPEEPFDADVAAISLISVHGTVGDGDIEVNYKTTEPWPLKVTKKVEMWSHKIRRIALIRKVILTLKTRIDNRKKGITETRLRTRKTVEPKKDRFVIHLTEDERLKAENLLIAALQSECFEKEILKLVKFGIFSPNAISDLKMKDSKLNSLSPFIDEHNLLRAGGRAGKADFLPFDTKYPIILPNSSNEVVRSLIRFYHSKFGMHTTQKQTLTLIREKYFVLGGKVSVNSVISKCVKCQRLDKQTAKQIEGDLPIERMALVPPFTNCGLDALGPFHLKHTGRNTKKQFVLIGCCMSTRAIALIPLRDMTTSAVINSLIKIHSQFPALKKLFSDNGSNFRGADREIQEAMKAFNKQEINKKLEQINLSWEFGPAHCGAAGGAWERLIKMVKKLLRSVIGQQNVDVNDFETLLSGAASVMNRRPLTAASADVNDTLPITPSHFLYPYLFVDSTHLIPPCTGDPETLRHGWKSSQALLDKFWIQFKSEYLTELTNKRRGANTKPIKIGTLVLVKDDAEPREYWPLGRVINILNQDHDHPRRFQIRLANGRVIDRHINSTLVLELDQ